MVDRTMRSSQVARYIRDFYADETLSNVARPYDDMLYISAQMGNHNAREILSHYGRSLVKEHPVKDFFKEIMP